MEISPRMALATSGSIVARTPAIRTATARAVSPERLVRMKASQTEASADRVLVQRFNGGDAAAFVDIVARHHERIMTLAMRYLRNHADAEEIVQDTFIRAHRGLARFRGEASLATWLHRIGFNLARNRYWYFHRRRRHLTLSLDSPVNGESSGTFSDLVASGEATPARHVAMDEFVALVATCMQQLEVGQREILVLRSQLHQTYDEIARALGINEGTVKSRIARARGQLRDLMSVACPEFSLGSTQRDWFEPMRTSNVGGIIAAI